MTPVGLKPEVPRKLLVKLQTLPKERGRLPRSPPGDPQCEGHKMPGQASLTHTVPQGKSIKPVKSISSLS